MIPNNFFEDAQEEAYQQRIRELTYGLDRIPQNPDLGMNPDFSYAQRVDEASATVFYKAWAAPGSSSADAAWRLQRITLSSTEADATTEWADGNTNYDKIWDDRATYTYS
jgi:hypothetical protein